jgi:hypothetical protein
VQSSQQLADNRGAGVSGEVELPIQVHAHSGCVGSATQLPQANIRRVIFDRPKTLEVVVGRARIRELVTPK